MKSIFTVIFIFATGLLMAQHSVHQEQLEHYNNLGITADQYEQLNQPAPKVKQNRAGCNPNKIVFGWHPYWSNGLQSNYDWSLMTDFSYFSYEVNPNTGNPYTTHNWSTAQAVDDAMNAGVRVNLCVTLFNSHTTLFGNPTAVQNLITNLINLVQSRGADGVNIDFEGIPSSQKTNFTNFMIDLSNQMHAAIPGSQVSTVLYSVDWNGVFDIQALDPYVDLFVIMGYGYYYSGSSTAGPTDPLYHFGNSFNYTLSKTVTYYLDEGVTPSKLILGLPYYGREWPTSSLSVPSSTTGGGSAKTFKQVKNNSGGNYNSSNFSWDQDSYTSYYAYNDGGQNYQCFIDLQYDFGERLDFINQRGIGGMGIWALGYDDGYNDYWDMLYEKFTDCGVKPCTDTLYDMGGPNKDYYNDENYTYTISPDGASQIDVTFNNFDVEANYDYLYIYDGADINAPQINGSPFTGTNSPGSFTSSTGDLTFRFVSDGATVTPGWEAVYTCLLDNVAPTTQVVNPNNWITADYTNSFVDADNVGGTGVAEKYYQVIHYDGNEWRANASSGFYSDNFDQAIHSDWTQVLGTWSINNAYLNQSNEAEFNTNIYASLNQNNADRYLYHWSGMIDGAGTNRRAGFHFHCDDATQSNRGNSYFVWFRVDSDKIQIYKVNNNTISLEADIPFTINAGQWYDIKTTFDTNSGEIKVYMDDVLSAEWVDASPHTTAGDYISFRSGNANYTVNNLKVYTSRSNSANISVGNGMDMAYQNQGPLTPAARVKSIVIDSADNVSSIDFEDIDVDWTAPAAIALVEDGLTADVDTFYTNTEIKANWSSTTDQHSDVVAYWYAVGTSAGATDVVGWTNNQLNTSVTHTGLNLTYGTTYYISVKAENGADLESTAVNTDGQYLDTPSQQPVANFSPNSTVICQGDSVQFNNSSANATSYVWAFPGGSPATSTLANPKVTYPSSGAYTAELIANGPGGADTTSQSINITITSPPIADFSASDTLVGLPNAYVGFTNNSTGATNYYWDFDDGSTSTDGNPWHQFNTTGTYNVMLVASNGNCPDDTTYVSVVVGITDIAESNSKQFQIFPNPANNELIVSFTNLSKNGVIEILTAEGRLVRSINIATGTERKVITLTDLESGMYFVSIKRGGAIFGSKKLIIR